MKTLEEIWRPRFQRLNSYGWNGTAPSTGFDLSKPLTEHSSYNHDNYMDLAIKDFRDVLTDISEHEIPEGLNADDFRLDTSTDSFHHATLTSTAKNPGIKVVCDISLDQKQFTIYLKRYGVFSVSWYKNRGGIDSMIDTEYGYPITLGQLTDILIALKLEKGVDDDSLEKHFTVDLEQ